MIVGISFTYIMMKWLYIIIQLLCSSYNMESPEWLGNSDMIEVHTHWPKESQISDILAAFDYLQYKHSYKYKLVLVTGNDDSNSRHE